MKTLTFEVPDELYQAFEQTAARDGRPVKAVAAEWLAEHEPKPRPNLTEEESKAAWERLLRHAGSVETGDPHSADNERIDADLAREYANNHEDEP
jgi:LPS sulfotransferase NodH